MFRLIALIQSGGWMIVPILFASIVTVALIFEAFWMLGKSRKRFEAFLLNPKAAQGLPGTDAFASLLSYRMAHPQATLEEIRGHIDLAFGGIERKISWLQTIAAIAPLLGLLGTVSGMIHNFSLVATTRPTNPLAQLSAGISEALVATAGGLVVALIAAIGYHWLTNAVDALVARIHGSMIVPEPKIQRPEEVSLGS